MSLLKAAKKENKDIVVFVTANKISDAIDFYSKGADYVILPHFLGGERVSSLVTEHAANIRGVIKHREEHIEELKQTWSSGNLTQAVKMFVDSFYGEDKSVLKKALSDSEFKKIK